VCKIRGISMIYPTHNRVYRVYDMGYI